MKQVRSSRGSGVRGAIPAGNRDFQEARQAKKDEFYTSLSDIEVELAHYTKHFQGKVVYCNCDDPRVSNFFRYFSTNFERLGLKKLITTSYQSQDPINFSRRDSSAALRLEYTGPDQSGLIDATVVSDVQPLQGDGDFRSSESVELLKQADIIVTNPPFSLFREYIAQLVEHEKQFLIIGNMNAVTYNEVFPLIQANKLWYGPSIRAGDREFRVPDDYPLTATGARVDHAGNKFIRVKGVRWFTNLDYAGRHVDLPLTQRFDPALYPTYANFEAIDVSRTKDIPKDYPGLMGVPISFLDRFSPAQFEIVGSSKSLGRKMSEIAKPGTYQIGGPRFYLPNGDGTFRRMYDRIVIKNKRL